MEPIMNANGRQEEDRKLYCIALWSVAFEVDVYVSFCYTPGGTWRNNNVIITSEQHRDVVLK